MLRYLDDHLFVALAAGGAIALLIFMVQGWWVKYRGSTELTRRDEQDLEDTEEPPPAGTYERGERVMSVDEAEKEVLRALKRYGSLGESSLYTIINAVDPSAPIMRTYTLDMALQCLRADGLVTTVHPPGRPVEWERVPWLWYRFLKLKMRRAKDQIEGIWHMLLS